ncbi:MAG: hypothetical protein KGS48_07105, partial [Bacteroidetes bacterium]|nr:hypothetical protein [Bacteroidota bacterium]
MKKRPTKPKSNGLIAPGMRKTKAAEQPQDPWASQRLLCRKLSHWIFTDFEQARQALEQLGRGITTKTPLDIQLQYQRSAAFLDNQWNRLDSAASHIRRAISIGETLSDTAALIELWSDLAAIQLNSRDWAATQESLDRARHYQDEHTAPALKAHI